ncbi:mannose-6-phosphate isomerase-like protein (cupin superfamily) [Rhodobium orientis]|uniref:Cupin n=1 Tax=Rhodobium orientis TaxID=34017 RepID=A0A327JKE4_9HYPH|nr:cupin domain-containing protein [Rhodobium orientis]MBB4305475.1 mannose-6-phosphate isomerase-like protein (cupin superfamily) [Rhodobium orientis]MBK5948671.1 cupin [Rhodobium orientis]RAI25292.1 cupin [Rhodobium orientis]
MPSFVFSLAAARTSPLSPDRASALLFEYGSMSLRYYAPDKVDRQTPHDQDEIYVVASGSGTFECAGEKESFATGDALFAPAGADHRFLDFTDDFAVWVIFYGPTGGEA